VSARIAWLVAATSSAVVLAFVLPLCLLVRQLAQDRAMASAEQEARNVAVLVSGLHGDPSLPALVADVDERSPATTSVLAPDGRSMGTATTGLRADPAVRRAASQGRAFTVLDSQGGAVLVPVVTDSGTYVVRTSVTPATLHRGVYGAWAAIGALGLTLMLFSVLVAWRMGRRISTPVMELAGVATRWGHGDLRARAPSRGGPGEVTILARAFNTLAERVTELLEAERSRVGDLSHRLRTPVTALRLDADSVRDPDLRDRLQVHITHLQRSIDSIVHDARRPLSQPLQVATDATTAVGERMHFWSALAEDQGRPLWVELPSEPVVVTLDRAALTDVVDVLVDNVFAHTADDVGFEVRLGRDGERARLDVADHGTGLRPAPSEDRPLGRTGQGLQIVRRTVATVGGDVLVSDTDRGTTATVWLPVADAE
jgi:signal transduction histidine kinase